MSIPLSPGDFQKPDVQTSQRREWAAERLGWLAFGLILTVGALGGFGGGPLAHATRSAGGASLAFDRFVRHGVATQLRLTVGPEAVVDGQIRVAVDWTYLNAVDVRSIHPAPARSMTSGEALILDFAVTTPVKSLITFDIEPRQAGRQSGRIEVGNTGLELNQMVFP